MIDWLLAPLQYEFMVRGLLAAIMVGIVCAVLGTYVVLRGMAFFGDALAHAILPGVAVAYLISGGAQGALFCGRAGGGDRHRAGHRRHQQERPDPGGYGHRRAVCRRCSRWASR